MILRLKNIEKTKAAEFVSHMDSDFNPKIAEQVPINFFIEKLIKSGFVYGYLENYSDIKALIGFYANDYVNKLGYISYLAVSPSLSGQGIAKRLVSKALEVSADQGMKKVIVRTGEANLAAKKVYLKQGFVVVETVFERSRSTIVLEKKIDTFGVL